MNYVNRYGSKEQPVVGRTCFATAAEAQAVPCAQKPSFVDTCLLVPKERVERIIEALALSNHSESAPLMDELLDGNFSILD